MKRNLLLMVVVLAIGCATTNSRSKCTVVSAHSATELDVCIGSDAVKVGDRVGFYKSKCSVPSRGSPGKCEKVKVGEGTVVKALDEHISTVKLESEFEVNANSTIEKIQ